MEDTIKIELLTPLTGNFTSRELERQWEEGEYEYEVYEEMCIRDSRLCSPQFHRIQEYGLHPTVAIPFSDGK